MLSSPSQPNGQTKMGMDTEIILLVWHLTDVQLLWGHLPLTDTVASTLISIPILLPMQDGPP